MSTAGSSSTVQSGIPKDAIPKDGVQSEQQNRFHLLAPALSHSFVPRPSQGRSPAPAQQFMTSAAFQVPREFWNSSWRLLGPPTKRK